MLTRLQGNQISEDELKVALEKTSRQAQRAGQIIQRIRSFVKRSETNRVNSAVAPIVAEAVDLADIELRRRQVKLSLFVSDRLSKLHIDPILIEQVLINLLKNAAEAIEHAQRPINQRYVELQVVPKEVEGQDVVEFSVSDSGSGMTAEVMERVFEAFYTTKSEGMGMGLNICRTIVEFHEGRLWVEPAEPTGCVFRFTLPLAEAYQEIEESMRVAL
jgi:signal transduction histidine kinase